MKAEKPNPSAAADRLKDLGLLYDAAFQNSDYEWQGKQFTEAYDRLHRFVEAQQTDTLSELRTQIEAEIDFNKSVLRTDYVIARVAALYWVLSRMTQLDSAQTAKKEGPK